MKRIFGKGSTLSSLSLAGRLRLPSIPFAMRTSVNGRHNIVASDNCGKARSQTEEMKSDDSSIGDRQSLSGYKLPPKEILDIVDQPREPIYSFSPKRDWVIEMKRPPANPSVVEYTRPELKLAGVRIDPSGFCRSKLSYYTGLSLSKKNSGFFLPFRDDVAERKVVTGIPSGYGIHDVSWSPNGERIAFTIRKISQNPSEALPPSELWTCDIDMCHARKLVSNVNSVFISYDWMNDDTILVGVVADPRDLSRDVGTETFGPRCEDSAGGKKSQTRTYQDLLKNANDERMFDHYCQSSLIKIDVSSGDIFPLDDTPKVYTGVSCSPSGKYVTVSWLEKPWSYSVPCGRFPKVVQVWDEHGDFVREIANLPLALHIPLAFDSCRTGPRSISWRDDMPHVISWVECQDEGDPNLPVSPRDVIYSLDLSEGQCAVPTVTAKTDLRFSGILWCDESLALLYESEWKTRNSKTWIISPDGSHDPKLLFDLNYEDSYNDPGAPILRRNRDGCYVIAEIGKKRQILLSGGGASPEGLMPFLDLFDLETGTKRRLWQSSPPFYESMSTILSDHCHTVDGVIPLDGLEMLARRESEDSPPQFSIVTFDDKGELKSEKQISEFPHPYPGLVGMTKEILQYERDDGVKLNGTLYLPPKYDSTRDGKLPCVLWAYPREFKSKDTAGQMRKSPHQFINVGSTSPLMLVTQGYAVLEGPSFPIFAEGDEEPNDTYVEQLTASARAAISALEKSGYVDIKRVAVGGHSYGAFMAAGLLAHAPDLFKCGIARSGAYNRTMTPFGFQSEQRTLWEAKGTYETMSPFMNADKIEKPVLFIHGEADNNPGTFPLQSERMFAALKGHGVVSRLVILPYESHGYSARESILHCLAEMHEWLELYCRI
jgi:dipeptidyl aminopeptidase/acylaminoacyl peptidase